MLEGRINSSQLYMDKVANEEPDHSQSDDFDEEIDRDKEEMHDDDIDQEERLIRTSKDSSASSS